MGHHTAALGHGAVSGAVLAVAQHAVVSFGCIMYPGVEIAGHAGVDGTEEIEDVFLVVEIACRAAVLVPVDQILRHP